MNETNEELFVALEYAAASLRIAAAALRRAGVRNWPDIISSAADEADAAVDKARRAR